MVSGERIEIFNDHYQERAIGNHPRYEHKYAL
jgi:hypothetical protein